MKLKKLLFGMIVFICLLITIQGAMASVDLLDGLVSYWDGSFNSTTAIDVHSSNNGTASNSRVLNATGKISKGFDFSQGSDSIDTGTNFQNTSFSVGAWINSSGGTGNRQIFSNAVFSTYVRGWQLTLSNGNKASATINDGTSATFFEGTTTILTDTWYHFVLTYDGATKTAKIYVNGEEENNRTFANTIIFTDLTASAKIGRFASSSAEFFNGLIDEVAIWNRTLTSTEITALYNSGNGTQYPFRDSEININPSNPYSDDDINCSFSYYFEDDIFGIFEEGDLVWDIVFRINNETALSFTEDIIKDEDVNVLKILPYTYTTSGDNVTCEVTQRNIPLNITEDTLYSDTINVQYHILNITAINQQTGSPITTFFAEVIDSDIDNNLFNTTTGNIIALQDMPRKKTIKVWSNTHSEEYFNHTFNRENTTLTAYLWEKGAIRVRVFNETNNLNLTNVNIKINNYETDFEYINTTTGNELYFLTNETGELTIEVSKDDYSTRYYYETMGVGRYVILNSYLLIDYTDITFTVQNEFNTLVNDALITCYAIIDGELKRVAQGKTDFAGQVQIPLSQTRQYIIRVSAGDFLIREIVLTPLSTNYIIKLQRTTLTYTDVLETISYNIAPTKESSLDNNRTYEFLFSISDSSNSLDYFGIEIKLDDGTTFFVEEIDSSGGIIVYNFTTPINNSVLDTRYYFRKFGEEHDFEIKQKYFVYTSTNRSFDLLTTFRDSSDEFSPVHQVLIIILITLGILGTTSIFIGFNPMIMNIQIIVIFGIFTILGWINPWITALMTIPVLMLAFFLGVDK